MQNLNAKKLQNQNVIDRDSAEQLSKKAATGNWTEGKRFPSDVPEDDVLSWVNELHSKE